MKEKLISLLVELCSQKNNEFILKLHIRLHFEKMCLVIKLYILFNALIRASTMVRNFFKVISKGKE